MPLMLLWKELKMRQSAFRPNTRVCFLTVGFSVSKALHCSEICAHQMLQPAVLILGATFVFVAAEHPYCMPEWCFEPKVSFIALDEVLQQCQPFIANDMAGLL